MITLYAWMPVVLAIFGTIAFIAVIFTSFFMRRAKKERNIALIFCITAWLLALILQLAPNIILQ